jgi:LCP family protein required for cell wall assembly
VSKDHLVSERPPVASQGRGGVSPRLLLAIPLVVLGSAAFLYLRGTLRFSPEATPTAAAVVVVDPTQVASPTDSPPTQTLVATYTTLATREPATPTRRPTARPTPTPSRTPTVTPTSRPQYVPTPATLAATAEVSPTPTISGTQTVVPTPVIPTAVAPFAVPSGITNILLLGSDIDLTRGNGRTDTMIVVSINPDGPTASMVSLPRDLYVYIPGWTMNRLNTALERGSATGYPGGPVALLRDTILYNFGVPLHYYAQIDFEGFRRAVDLMGGVDVAVSCQVRDIWELKSPELDPYVLDNYNWRTLAPGLYHMDGTEALWYARSRRTSSDFDRGRRQQQVLRSMLNQGVDLNLLPQVPELWSAYQENVRTDIDIGRLLQLVSIAPQVRANGVQHLYIVGNQLQPYVVPGTGAQVQVPRWENMQYTLQRLFQPPALNRASRPPITVEVVNGTGNADLAALAADNLAWYGFEPVLAGETEATAQTTIQYYAQNFKGSFDWLLSWIFHRLPENVTLVPDTPHPTNYRVVLGRDYDPCVNQLFAPQQFIGG